MAHVIIGASIGLGRALAERFAREGRSLILVARDRQALDTLAAELTRDHGVDVAVVAADIAQGPEYLEAVTEAAAGQGGVESLLLPVGLALRDDVGADSAQIRQLVAVNFTGLAEAIARLWPIMAKSKGATIVGFGSIAAARGRGRNLVYGAMKRALEAYFEGLHIAARGTPIRVQFYVCGFLDTESMRNERTPLPKGNPAHLARLVHAGLGHDFGVRHFPRWWGLLLPVLKALPWRLYARVVS